MGERSRGVTIAVNRQLPRADVPIVGVDYARGIRDLIEHLRALGHRRLASLGGPAASASNAERLRELGVDVPRDLSVAGFDDVPMARESTAPPAAERNDA